MILMKLVLVGQKDGRRKICWLNYFVLGISLSLITGLGVGGVFYCLSGKWSHGAVLYGIMIGAGTLALGFIRGLKMPIDKLPKLP
jgi:hypothetical protein